MCAKKKKAVKAKTPQKKRTVAAKETVTPIFSDSLFPVAAIGGSAGGIEAISQFLTYLQPDLGIAYVIIQHLAHDHSSILPSLLEKRTAMKVHLVKDGMKVEPDNVYVIPPATYMTITDGHLALTQKHKTDKERKVFDYFLQSLAPIYQHKAIAIVLSGVGFDGTQGVQAIKAEGGITFAQDDSALFQSMARNAYESGHIDFILSPEGIANELAALSRQNYAIESPEVEMEVNERAIKKIHLLLHNRFGVDFAHYKGTAINRRILRRMDLNRLKELEQYIRLLREDQTELELLYRDLLINVTSFFREPGLFNSLNKTIFPSLFKNRKPGEPLRIWIPACSSGEEACSMAICLFEYLGEKAFSTPIQIFATDLSETAIEKARTGIYSKNMLQHISAQRLKQFFVKVDGSYQIIKPIREICIFATHNLLKDPPFSRIDLISCQNVMIYLASSAQKKILLAFHYALRSGGYLVLGKSETIGSDTDLFETVDEEQKLYVKKAISQSLPLDFKDDIDVALQKSKQPVQQKKGRPDSKDRRIDILEQELKDAREHMKTMNEEFDATREELQSANEEVLSSNEELETSKEEMQSTNEELITINEELQLRNADLKESVEYTEAIVQTIREPLVVLNTDLRIRTANKAFYSLFNLQQDIDGYYFFELAGGLFDVPALRQQLLETVTKGIGFQDFELRHHFRDLGEKTLLFNAMRMHGEGEKRARILLAIGNVTERKRAEESLRRSVEQLRESEERLRVAMEAAKMGTWDWNVVTGEILWSSDHNVMYGIPVDRRSGTYKEWLQYIHPHDRDNVAELMQRAIDTRKDFAMEMRSLHANGRTTWIAAFGRAFYNDQGKAHRLTGVVIDITERKRLENQKEGFIAIASHELRTPVTSIKSYTELLHEMLKERKDTEAVEIVDKLDRQIDRLAHLIADLLDITRIGEGQLLLHPEVFDINTLINEMVELMQRTTIQHVLVQELQSLPPVRADRERIGQVLINLLGNAIKYSPNGRRIIIRSEPADQRIKVSIQDFGIGMAEETRQKVFERFFRASDNSVQTYPGLGLGLFIAADIIKKHGGEIGVISEIGKGTLIHFTLPVQPM